MGLVVDFGVVAAVVFAAGAARSELTLLGVPGNGVWGLERSIIDFVSEVSSRDEQ